MPSCKRDMAMEMIPATPASLDRSGAMSLGNQSVHGRRADLRAGSRSGCFATPVGLTAVVSCGLR